MSNTRNVNTINIASKDIYIDVFTAPKDRRGFYEAPQAFTLPVFFYRIIGIEQTNEDEYYNAIYNLDIQLQKFGELYKRMDFSLDVNVQAKLIERINFVWNEIKGDSNLRAPYISANFHGAGILKFTKDSIKDALIKDSFQKCLDVFISLQKQAKNPSITKNFCIKILYWFEKYALSLFKAYNFKEHNPKILFYGDIKRDEIFFLIFLSGIGFDILYLNPYSDSGFNTIDPEYKYSTKMDFSKKCLPQVFPTSEKLSVVETVALQAEKNIETMLVENVNFLKPWQFEGYDVKSVTLKTTYEELMAFWSIEARYRDGFKIFNNTIYLPNIFAKVNGTNTSLQTYWSNILKFLKEKDEFIYIIDKLPFSQPMAKSQDYRLLMDKSGVYENHKVKGCKDYSLSYLKPSTQDLIINKANELIQNEYFNFNMDINIKTKVLSTILNIDKDILKMLQRFDYPFIVPKILIYHNTNTLFSTEDHITLAFLDSIGFDIVIFTPSGYSNIENGLKRNLFDVHNLEQLKFDLDLSKEIKREIRRKQEGNDNNLIGRFKTWLK